MRTAMLLMTALLLCVACTDKKESNEGERTLTQRERDSIIGQSALPGARGVRGALSAADSARARADRASQIR
jgi:hypothetical protein